MENDKSQSIANKKYQIANTKYQISDPHITPVPFLLPPTTYHFQASLPTGILLLHAPAALAVSSWRKADAG